MQRAVGSGACAARSAASSALTLRRAGRAVQAEALPTAAALRWSVSVSCRAEASRGARLPVLRAAGVAGGTASRGALLPQRPERPMPTTMPAGGASGRGARPGGRSLAVGAAAAAAATAAVATLMPAWLAPALVPLALLLATGGLLTLAAWLDVRAKTAMPTVTAAESELNRAVLPAVASLARPYRPTLFLTNGHVETIFAALCRTFPEIKYRREFLTMSDGGIVTLDWDMGEPGQVWTYWDMGELGQPVPPNDAPVMLLLPGLTGGSGCSYVRHAAIRMRRAGFRSVVFNSRGTEGSPVTTPQFYSASFTGDMHACVDHVAATCPNSTLVAAGWSLGGNILLRYLAEQGTKTPVAAAMSMCNPFELTIANANFGKGFNKIYDRKLADSLKKIFGKHQLVWNGYKGPGRPDLVPSCRTVREFDEYITRHSFGWPSVDAYYAGSSSTSSVPHVTVPTLCVQALDDPIAPAEAIPYAEIAANPNFTLVCTPTGGHLGWISADGAISGEPWTNGVMADWFTSVVSHLGRRGGANGNGSKLDAKSDAAEVAVKDDAAVGMAAKY